jgi:predicted molibdopterin-dependent oxidoreductase YjgC
MTSCLVCIVKLKLNGRTSVVPSCGMKAQAGMVVESETPEVHDMRRTALELLLSDHVGDCFAPCHRICPLKLMPATESIFASDVTCPTTVTVARHQSSGSCSARSGAG